MIAFCNPNNIVLEKIGKVVSIACHNALNTVKSPIEAWLEYRPVPKQRQFNRVLTWIESSFEHIPSKLRGYQMKCVISFILLGLKSRNSSSTPVTDENWPTLACTNTKQISFNIIECFQNFQQKIESWLEYSPDSITVPSQNAKF